MQRKFLIKFNSSARNYCQDVAARATNIIKIHKNKRIISKRESYLLASEINLEVYPEAAFSDINFV